MQVPKHIKALRIIAVSEEDLATIEETLHLDAQSSAFDRELRLRIGEAAGGMEDVTAEVMALLAAYPGAGYGVGEQLLALAAALGWDAYTLDGS